MIENLEHKGKFQATKQKAGNQRHICDLYSNTSYEIANSKLRYATLIGSINKKPLPSSFSKAPLSMPSLASLGESNSKNCTLAFF